MKFKKFLKYLLFFLLILGVGFLYSFSSDRNQQKKISKIKIKFEKSTSKFLNDSIVNKLLIQNSSALENKSKTALHLYSLEKSISENPFVERATVCLTINGNLETVVTQRTPIVRVMQGEEVYYVDKQGIRVPLSEMYSARVLLVSGIKNQIEIKELMPLITVVLEDDFLQKEVVGLEKMTNNEVQLAVRSGDYRIDFGDADEINQKVKKLKAFYNNTFLDNTIQNFKVINLKYHNQVVCTK